MAKKRIDYNKVRAIDITDWRPIRGGWLDGVKASFELDSELSSGTDWVELTGPDLEQAVSEMTSAQEGKFNRRLKEVHKSGFTNLRFLSDLTNDGGFPETKTAPKISTRDVLNFIEDQIDMASDPLKVSGELITTLTNAVTQALKQAGE